jgi:hypothetical protein
MNKSLKNILAASALAVGFANVASAATVDVYLTGSSAFRAAVTNSIIHLLSNPVGAYEGTSTASGAIAGANQQLIVGVGAGTTGGLSTSNTYYFHTCWTGSLGGLSTLVYGVRPTLPASPVSGQNVLHAYLPDTITGLTTVTASGGGFGANPTGGEALTTDVTSVDTINGTNRYADGAFSDVLQSSTKITGTALTAATVKSGLSDGIVGVVPFVFVAGYDLANFNTGSTGTTTGPLYSASSPNMTATNARALYGASGLDVAQLTGNSADDTNSAGQILAVGRDPDSGTRFTTFAETGFNPIGGNNLPTQYQVQTGTFSGGATVDVSEYPAETLFKGGPAEIDLAQGQGGYSSGSNERGALAIAGTSGSSSDFASYVIGSLGESDAINIVKGGGGTGPCYMAYNGVAYATSPTSTASFPFNRTALDQGAYTFWGYEHCYLDPGTSTTNAAVVNAVASEVRAVDAPIAGEAMSNMSVSRSVEGGAISYVGLGQSKL